MNKFSVIIPTIWKSEYTMELLQRYSNCDYVGQIILIDNAPTKDISINKLIHIKEEENTYVNPAWNKGVSLSFYNHLTISNDDILFDVDEYYEYISQLNPLENFGYTGAHSENYELSENDNPRFEEYSNQNNFGGWGCLFSFHKSNWKPLPNELKIWYGDNLIHGWHNPILQLRGFKMETKMSTSSDDMSVRAIRDRDTQLWTGIIK
jgi:hypothetical protein